MAVRVLAAFSRSMLRGKPSAKLQSPAERKSRRNAERKTCGGVFAPPGKLSRL